MSTEKIHAVDGTLAFEVDPNGDQVGVRVTTHLPAGEGSLSVPLDGNATRGMAAAMLATLATSRHAARPAAQDAPAAPPAGVGTSDAANGAQGGAGGLGARIRDVLARTGRPSEVALREWADRADALEREAYAKGRDEGRDQALVEAKYDATLYQGDLNRLAAQIDRVRATVAQFDRVRRNTGDSHAAFAALREIRVALERAQ